MKNLSVFFILLILSIILISCRNTNDNRIFNSDNMQKLILLLFTSIILSTLSYGQNELELYKRIYKTADSLKTIGKLNSIDTTTLFANVKLLDKKHPSGYLEASGEYITKSKFNEAAFLYYLGLMRFRYYNSANPKYQANNDGALLGSLKYVLGDPINMYLRTDIDNFISIVKLTTSYYNNNDYKYFSKAKNIEKFNAQLKSYNDLILDLETNKEKYKAQWDSERIKMEEKIDMLISEQKK